MIHQPTANFKPPRLNLTASTGRSETCPNTSQRIYDYLRAAGGRRVTIDELVTGVLCYPDGADPYARATVHTHVSYLRRDLPAGVTVRYRRQADAEGYELRHSSQE